MATTHTPTWMDGQAAGYTCSAARGADGVIHVENAGDEEHHCAFCGARIRLVWDVRIETAPETPETRALEILTEESRLVVAAWGQRARRAALYGSVGYVAAITIMQRARDAVALSP